MPQPTHILVVDDDRRLADGMAVWLGELGHRCTVAYDLDGACRRIDADQTRFDLAIVDLRLGDDDGMELVRKLTNRREPIATLVMTGFATPSTAVAAIRNGAGDVLTKPVIDDELQLAIDRTLKQSQIESENVRLREQLDRRTGMESVLSHDYRMLKVFDTIDSVADTKASILITGENGTGKSMIARAIHERSSRRGGPLVEVACGALPDNLLESELFGHQAGAFTGATTDRIGKFEAADNGTLFLDEIATATPAMQVKLLRVLQEMKFEPLGGTETREVDTRVIFATNEDLSTAVTDKRFRQDLYYRINVINLHLPPLRERSGDVPLLVQHFVRQCGEEVARDVEGFDRDAMSRLTAYAWPGNIRQLENVVQRAVLLSSDPVMTVEDLPPEIGGGTTQPPNDFSALVAASNDAVDSSRGPSNAPPVVAGRTTLKDALEGPERAIILATLRANDWSRVETAKILDINRTTLYKKMKRLGLEDPRLAGRN